MISMENLEFGSINHVRQEKKKALAPVQLLVEIDSSTHNPYLSMPNDHVDCGHIFLGLRSCMERDPLMVTAAR